MKKPLAPVPQARVRIDDAFWAPRLQTNRFVTIPLIYQRCVETGRLAVLRSPGKSPSPSGQPAGPSDVWESEVSKWLEAASYALASHPDPALSRQVDEVIELVRSAQQPDGYLNISGAALNSSQHWTDLQNCHELYCASHLLDAAVAHFQSTGKRTLLDVACRFADHIAAVFGPELKRGYPARPGIELALARLHDVTGEARYLALAQHFIEERGRVEKPQSSHGPSGTVVAAAHECGPLNSPVRQQTQAVGHAARALSLYAALTEVGRETGDDTLIAAALRLWDSVYTKQTYVTGGIGSSRTTQGFTCDYDLPNESAWAETCASIASVYWNHRLLHWNCEARFGDEMERALFNGVLAAVSLDGQRFFHSNPLTMRPDRIPPGDPLVKAQRVNGFPCPCCPPNLARLLASLGQYIYSESDSEIAVHLFVQSRVEFHVKGQRVVVRQETEYPWEGNVRLTIESMPTPSEFAVRIRLPGWCRDPQVDINGVAASGIVRNGYAVLRRQWRAGDSVQLMLAMPVERVRSHPMVLENRGCVALRRGPLVYCLESVDNGPLDQLALPSKNFVEARFEPGLFGGSKIIYGHAVAITEDTYHGPLYRQENERWREAPLRAIPYYCWANRMPGEMRVWIREAEVRP